MIRAGSRYGRRWGTFALAGLIGVGVWLATETLYGQQQFELYISAIEAQTQRPATDLTRADIGMTERGEPGRIVRVEPYQLPVRLTILVDNGSGMREALVHYRSGLRALLEALPGDLPVEVIALAPNPRWLARMTTNRVQLLRSVQLLTPEADFAGHFNDALVEYATRLNRDLEREGTDAVGDDGRLGYLPILVVVGSTGHEGSQPRRDDLRDMLDSMVRHGVRTYFAMHSQHSGAAALNTGSQVLVAKAVQELTGGEYVPLAASSRVATLLPEWGARIATTHRAASNQYRVTMERPEGMSGPLTDLSMFIRREGYSGIVTIDGRVP